MLVLKAVMSAISAASSKTGKSLRSTTTTTSSKSKPHQHGALPDSSPDSSPDTVCLLLLARTRFELPERLLLDDLRVRYKHVAHPQHLEFTPHRLTLETRLSST